MSFRSPSTRVCAVHPNARKDGALYIGGVVAQPRRRHAYSQVKKLTDTRFRRPPALIAPQLTAHLSGHVETDKSVRGEPP